MENFFVKEKNFNLRVQMVDLEGQKVMNCTLNSIQPISFTYAWESLMPRENGSPKAQPIRIF